MLHLLEIPGPKAQDHGHCTLWFFLDHLWKFYFFFAWVLEFLLVLSSVPLKIHFQNSFLEKYLKELLGILFFDLFIIAILGKNRGENLENLSDCIPFKLSFIYPPTMENKNQCPIMFSTPPTLFVQHTQKSWICLFKTRFYFMFSRCFVISRFFLQFDNWHY